MDHKLLDVFIVRPCSNAEFDHWQGGTPIHQDAVCRRCNKPFQLIWHLNCLDPRFKTNDDRPIFSGISRLALYWCFRCGSSIDYTIVRDESVDVICIDREPVSQAKPRKLRESFPYPNYPDAFHQQAIALSRVVEMPTTVQELLGSATPPQLTEAGQQLLEEYVGHRVTKQEFELMRGTWVHQFGGEPFLPQGDDWIVCRNGGCPRQGQRLPVIAAIHNDPPNGLPFIQTMEDVRKSKTGFFNFFVTVYFHMCVVCNTIHGHSQGS